MARILHAVDDDPDFVSLGEFVEHAAQERDELAAIYRQSEKAALRSEESWAGAYEKRIASKLDDPRYEPTIYETIHNCVRVSPAQAALLGEVPKRKTPEQHPGQWRRPGVRFIPPRKRVVLNNP